MGKEGRSHRRSTSQADLAVASINLFSTSFQRFLACLPRLCYTNVVHPNSESPSSQPFRLLALLSFDETSVLRVCTGR
jgi:hypothetical protein